MTLTDKRGEDGSLTLKEYHVARLVTQGLTNKQIAEVLNRSPFSVRNVIIKILRKLNFKTRAQIAFAVGTKNADLILLKGSSDLS